ncbi:hypothetical protein EBF04_29950 [Streptomyces sp. I6]|nr:hypothetical protein EBF04_29950 [Streptomyces sp. I6]
MPVDRHSVGQIQSTTSHRALPVPDQADLHHSVVKRVGDVDSGVESVALRDRSGHRVWSGHQSHGQGHSGKPEDQMPGPAPEDPTS